MKVVFSLLLVVFCLMHLCLGISIAVTGQVICNKRSMSNVQVILRERDVFDPDDTLDEVHTDKDGYFKLKGVESEIGKIKPYIRIFHNCDVKNRATCKRESEYDVPMDVIKREGVYEMNFVNLNVRAGKDTEKCS